MKKIYNKPTTEVVKMLTANLIAASAQMYGENATGDAMSKEDEDYGYDW